MVAGSSYLGREGSRLGLSLDGFVFAGHLGSDG